MSEAFSTGSSTGNPDPRAETVAPGGETSASPAERRTPDVELQRARERLAAEEERFRSIVERSVDGVIVLDPQGWVRFANTAAESLFGRARQELIGSDFGYPAVVGENTEIDLIPVGGSLRTAEMRVMETTWEGRPALLVLIRDVTDRKAAEERARELMKEQLARAEAEAHARHVELLDRASRSLGATLELEELLRRLASVFVEEIGDVCLIDIDDRSGPMRRLTAARRDYPRSAQLKGLEERPVWLGVDTAEARVFRTGTSEVIRDVTPEWLEAAADCDEPTCAFSVLEPCSLMMVTLYAGSLRWGVVTILSCNPSVRYGRADLSIAEELVRRAAITVENARLFRLAQEASRAKSHFLAIISHELRTPLSAIVGYAGLMESGIGGELSPTHRQYLSAVRRSADHLIRLIEQLISFARLDGDHERVEIGPVDLVRLVADLALLTRPLADRKKLALFIHAPRNPAVVESDEKKLSQILINLVTNAIKYTESGEVHVSADVEDEELVLRVQDTGRGIPPEKLTEIFEPFHQLHDSLTRREGGAGIGLSIVKNLTRLLGGEVAVTSRPGAGSTFSVRLPLVRTSAGTD